MSNKIFYIDIESGKLLNVRGGQILDRPTIAYQEQPTWEIHFVSIGTDGTLIPGDLSQIGSWKAAVDTDFDSSTTPMIRTLPDGFDVSNNDKGIILVNLNANTETFFEKIDGKQSVDAVLELRGVNTSGRLVYDYKIKITCVGSVDPTGTQPLPVQDNVVTQEWVQSLIYGKANTTDLATKADKIQYKDVDTLTFASNEYLRCTPVLTNIDMNIPAGLQNTMCIFTTGNTIEFSILIDTSYKINKAFAFEANTSYAIGIDNYTILWTKLENVK